MERSRAWFDRATGRNGAPAPPPLRSERIKALIGRAILAPHEIKPDEIQELAASALNSLIRAKDA